VAAAKRGETAARRNEIFRPEVDIYETGEEFVVKANVPGARPEAIDLNVEKGVLTMRAEVGVRTPENARPLGREYGVGAFERSFRIGEGIDTERIGAELKDGVLTLRLPKAETTRSRKISVQAAG
jgi:HSP20 family protein